MDREQARQRFWELLHDTRRRGPQTSLQEILALEQVIGEDEAERLREAAFPGLQSWADNRLKVKQGPVPPDPAAVRPEPKKKKVYPSDAQSSDRVRTLVARRNEQTPEEVLQLIRRYLVDGEHRRNQLAVKSRVKKDLLDQALQLGLESGQLTQRVEMPRNARNRRGGRSTVWGLAEQPPEQNSRYAEDQPAVSYGDDEAAFRAAIAADPLNLVGHGELADWYGDQGMAQQESLRRAIMGSMQRRLSTPFDPPQAEPYWANLVQPKANGPLDRYLLHLARRQPGRDYGAHHVLAPTGDVLDDNMANRWFWQGRSDWASYPPVSHLEGLPEYDDWIEQRRMNPHVFHSTHNMTDAERLYAGIEPLDQVDWNDPANAGLWQRIEQIMRGQHEQGLRLSRYGDSHSAVQYGLAEDEEAFRASIQEQPLDLTNHLVFADWLADQGRSQDEAFRRALAESMQRRLSTPWQEPASESADHSDTRYLTQPHAHGPVDPFLQHLTIRAPRTAAPAYWPTAPYAQWQWLLHGPQDVPGLRVPGGPNADDWIEQRREGTWPGTPPIFRS